MSRATHKRYRFLRRVLITAAALLIVLTVLLAIAFNSETAFRFVIATAQPLIPGELHYEKLDGTLAGPVSAAGVDYRIGETRLHADRVAFDFSPWMLLRGEITLETLHASALVVTLPPARDSGAAKPAATPREILDALALPVHLRVDDLDIERFALRSGNDPVFELGDLHAALDWSGEQIAVNALDAEGSKIDVSGTLVLGLREGHASRVDLQGDWRGGKFPVAGSIRGDGNARQLDLAVQLQEPAQAVLDAKLVDLLDAPGWQGTLKVISLQASMFDKTLPSTTWSGEFRFDGAWRDTRITGFANGGWPPATGIHATIEALANAERLQIESLDARIDAFDTNLVVEGALRYADELTYSASGNMNRFAWPGMEDFALHNVRFAANGTVDQTELELTAAAGEREQGRLEANGSITFADLQINADVSGNNLVFTSESTKLEIADISAEISGIPANYAATGIGRIKVNELPFAHIGVQANGDLEHVVADIDTVQWLNGTAKGGVTVTWQDALQLDAHMNGRNFNLAALDPRLNGLVGGAVALRANLSGEQPDISLRVDSLDGNIAGAELEGQGSIRFARGRLATEGLVVRAGDAQLQLTDTAAAGFDFQLAVPALGIFHSDATGWVQASGHLDGELVKPSFSIDANAGNLAWQDVEAKSLRLAADIDAGAEQESSFQINADMLETSALDVEHLVLDLAGRLDAHRISLDIDGAGRDNAGNAELAAQGSWQESHWRGDFSALQYAHPSVGTWQLSDADKKTMVTIGGAGTLIPEHCLQGPSGRACVGPVKKDAGGWDAKGSLRNLPVGVIAGWLPPGLGYTGEVSGDFSLDTTTNGIEGSAVFRLAPGGIRQRTGEDAETLLGWKSGRAQLNFDGRTATGELAIDLDGGGRIDGSGTLLVPKAGSITVDAGLHASIDNLQLVPSLVPELSRLQGRVTADVKISGPLEQPEMRGEVELLDGSARVLALGTDWNNIDVHLIGEGRELSMTGHAESGDGHIDIELNGSDTHRGFVGKAKLNGENFTAIQTPEVEVIIYPGLDLALQGNDLFIDGEVFVPMARIEPRDLSTAVQPSDDQVIVNAEGSAASDGMQVHVAVTTRLGDNVRIDAFGLTARMEGELTVSQLPGNPATGNGRLIIAEGQYKAYGQDLTLAKGEVIYTGQPLANPGLDIRAERHPQPDITVGVAVRGPLSQPATNVYSDPPMSETEALAYLLFGRSIEQATGEEEGQISEAAIALGLGGQKLLGNVGRRLGVEEVRVEDVGDRERASLVLGKYLSPDLYVSYGIGLFEAVNSFRIRYRISSKWMLEATSGLKSSADFIYTIER